MVNWFEMSATYVHLHSIHQQFTTYSRAIMNSGLALESLITLLTPRFISFFMLLLVIGKLEFVYSAT